MKTEMESSETSEDQPFWKMARHGVTMLLNNKQDEAENLFKKYPDSIQMYSGYATTVFMDAVMTFEDEKLAVASQALKETERRCSGTGWFKMVRGKIYETETMSYAEHLENQIIRADSQMYLATLTFLQQDISAYFKGGWILRKSWKHYQQTYNEIQSLYKQIVGEAAPVEATKSTDVVSSTVSMADDGTCPTKENTFEISSDMEIFDKNEILHSTHSSHSSLDQTHNAETEKSSIIRNGYIQKSNTMHFPPKTPSPDSTDTTSSQGSSNLNNIRKSQSAHSALSRYTQIQRSLSKFSPFNSNISLSYIYSFNPFGIVEAKPIDIDKETITRLMCGVSFGFGLLQLGMSLLPPSILKLTNFLGFQGNRKSGLTNLMYARKGTDMRAPLATLALLWYHTIVRPFFALDGHNVQAGVQAASQLIDEAMVDYADSSIFLFFKGRVDRLKSDIPSAIDSFNASVANSKHREVKILSQHEVGWCYLIQLDFKNSMLTFLQLRLMSRWSRSFYAYLATISAGSYGEIKNMENLDELKHIFASNPKGSQLDEFLARRFRICPTTAENLVNMKSQFWKLLIYELLYLWNSLPSCNFECIQYIINDCQNINKEGDIEPFLGLSYLVAGSAYCILKDYPNGVTNFRKCLETRKYTSYHADDAHISAFALYELGQLLIREPETKLEGKQCLQQVHSYKDYDFEQRLSVRIHSILKHL